MSKKFYENLTKKVEKAKLRESKIKNINEENFIYIVDDGSSFSSLKEALEWVKSEDGINGDVIIKEQIDCDDDELELCESKVVWTRENGELKEELLKEGTANFYTPEKFPLLIFIDYDEVVYDMQHDEDYPDIDDFDSFEKYDEARYDYEEEYLDNFEYCILDEPEESELQDELDNFNIETREIAEEKDIDEEGYQQYSNNLNLEDITLTLEPGYYSGVQIKVINESSFDDLDEDFREEQLERFNKFLKELKEKYGLTELRKEYTFSNGETGYSKVESLKESFEEIYIKYWENEDLRDQGISEIYRDNFATREEAIEVARKLVDRDDYASVEVFVSPSGTLESEDDELIWGYDGNECWGLCKEKEIVEESDESLKEDLEHDFSNIDLIDKFEFKNRRTNNVVGISNMRDFIDSLNKVGKDTFKCRTSTFGNNVSWGDIKDSLPELIRNGWRIGRAWDSSLSGFNEVYICEKESLKEGRQQIYDEYEDEYFKALNKAQRAGNVYFIVEFDDNEEEFETFGEAKKYAKKVGVDKIKVTSFGIEGPDGYDNGDYEEYDEVYLDLDKNIVDESLKEEKEEDYIYYIVSDGKNPRHSIAFTKNQEEDALKIAPKYKANYGYVEVLKYTNGKSEVILKNEEVEPVEIKRPKGFAGHKDPEIKKDVEINPIEEEKSPNKEYTVEVLYSEDGNHVTSFKVKSSKNYDSSKILNKFFKEHPNYKDDMYKVQITESLIESWEIPDDVTPTGETIKSPRIGDEIQVVKETEDELRKKGFGYYHNVDSYAIMTKNTGKGEHSKYIVACKESLKENVKKEKYIYLFPDSPAMGDYKDECMKFNLEVLGKNYYEDEKNLVIRGTEKDLRKYAEYLDYDLHPDYLYKEEDFAGEILPLEYKKVREGYSLLGAEDKNIELYSNYYTAQKRAEELGLKLAEYGDLYNSDVCYCYWNKSGNRFDDEEVICYYFYENGKPKHSVSQEELKCIAREIGLSVKDIDDADDAELEDEIDEEICEEWFCTVFDKEGNAKDFDSYEEAEKYGIETYGEGNFTIESPFQQSSIEESNNSSNVDIERCKEIVSQLTDYNSLSDEEIQSMIDDGIVVDEDMWITELRNLFSEDEITEDEYDYILNHIEELEESCSKNTKKSNLKEDIDEWDGDFDICCQDVADGLESGWWHGQTSSGRNWGLSVNGKDGNQFSPKFADVVAYECSYPVRDGYFSFAGLDCIPNKSTFYYTNFDNEDEREVIKTDLLNVGCSEEEIEEFFNGDDDAEIEFYIDYEIDDLEEFEENLKEGTVKQGKNWVNKGKEGTHGKFKTKKAADVQRKAMFANGYKENLNEDYSGFLGNYGFDYLRGIGDFEYWYFKDEKGFEEAVERIRKEYPKLIVSSSPSDKTIYIQKSKYGTKEPVTESKKEVEPFTKSQIMNEIKRDTANFSKDFEGHYGFEEEANIAEKILTKRGYDVDYHTEDSKLERGKTEYIIVATKTHVNENLDEGDVEYKGFTIKPLVIDSIIYGGKKLPGFTKYTIMKGDKYLPDEVYDLFKKDNKLETIDDYKKLIDNIKIKEGLAEGYTDAATKLEKFFKENKFRVTKKEYDHNNQSCVMEVTSLDEFTHSGATKKFNELKDKIAEKVQEEGCTLANGGPSMGVNNQTQLTILVVFKKESLKEDYSEDYYDDDYEKLLKRIAKSLEMPYKPEREDDYDNWNYVSLLHDCNNGKGDEWIEIFEKENLNKSLLKEFKRLLKCISEDEDFILEENKKNKTKKRPRFVGDMNAEMKFFNDSVGNTSLGGTSGE